MLKSCQQLLHAAHIITQNPQRTHLENASIAVDKGRIVGIGTREEMQQTWQAHKNKDLGKVLIMPGLVNAHTHAAMTFLRGFADDMPLMDWLNQCIFPVEQHLDANIVYHGALLGYAEMLRTGTIGCIDMYLFEKAFLRAAVKAGIRCLGGQVIFSFPVPHCANHQAALEQARENVELYRNNPRVNIAINPHSVYTTTPKILEDCRDTAEALNLPLHLHLAETANESTQCLSLWGKRPLPYCDDLGLLTQHTTLAHVVDVNAEDMDILARSGAVVAHNPSSNMKLASGVAPVPAMLARHIPVALGTDGAASNNRLNIFTEMGRAALLHKSALHDPTAMPAQRVLDMATLDGARAMHDTRLCQLVVGGPADMIALDLNAPNMHPLYEAASQLVYAATGMEVRMTMIEGEIVYEDGVMTRFDYPALLQEMESISRWVRTHKK
ncbi:MAG: amidohydrolase [Desulfovibrionaceae bacterium]